MTDKKIIDAYAEERANDILEVVMGYARMEFFHKTKISERGDVFDAIGTGINMLGEELESSVLSLREKEQLLKEVHHRVKNNLQIISSLLNLHGETTNNEQFLALIRESKNRVSSMALIHEMLYASEDLSKIKTDKYIVALTTSIYQSFGNSSSEVTFHYDLDPEPHFDLDRMIPIGLILNEIISNALKYAFPKRPGALTISLRRMNNVYELTAGDNGIGLPTGFDYRESKSLGIQLIHMLAEQIGAEIFLSNTMGVMYRFVFPV